MAASSPICCSVGAIAVRRMSAASSNSSATASQRASPSRSSSFTSGGACTLTNTSSARNVASSAAMPMITAAATSTQLASCPVRSLNICVRSIPPAFQPSQHPYVRRLPAYHPSSVCRACHATPAYTLSIRVRGLRRRQLYVQHPKARLRPRLTRLHRQRPREQRPIRHQCVILPSLPTHINAVPLERSDQLIRERLPQPRRIRPRLLHTRQQRPIPSRHHLACQPPRLLAPDRLHMRQPRRAHPLLVPCPHVRQMNVAEHHRAEPLCPQLLQRAQKHRLERLRRRRVHPALDPQRRRLRPHHRHRHPMKAHPSRRPIVERHQPPHVIT